MGMKCVIYGLLTLTVMLAWPSKIHACLAPTAIKGLATCCADARLSPLQGAVLWETGVVKNYYDRGHLSPSTKDRWLNHPDGPVRMARALFAVNSGNFDVSNNTNYPAYHMAPSTIANIIVYLEQASRSCTKLHAEQLEDFILRDQAFAQSYECTKKQYQTISAHYDEQIKVADAGLKLKLKKSRIIALNKCDTQRICRNWERVQKIASMVHRVAEIDRLKGREKQCVQKERARLESTIESMKQVHDGGDYNRVAECAQAIVDSTSPSPYYPPSICQGLLLACAYRKAQHKSDLAYYINAMAHELSPAVCKPVDSLWVQQQYEQRDMAPIKQHLAAEHVDFSLILGTAAHEDFAYARTCERFYAGQLPKIAEYKTITWQDTSFADCAETTLRNLCNIILYNREAGIFDVSKAPCRHACAQLLEFYTHEINKCAINVELPEVYFAWGPFMQNQPLITYRTMITRSSTDQKIVLKASLDCMGFIWGLPEHAVQRDPEFSDRVIIDGHSYILVDPEKAQLCEMHPTLRNVIIIMDRLFDLHLFEGKDLCHEFLKGSFNARYLPQLCACFDRLKNCAFDEATLRRFDTDEYTKKGIRIKLQDFDLLLTSDHAEIISEPCEGASIDEGQSLIRLLIDQRNCQPSSDCACADNCWTLSQLLPLVHVNISQLPLDMLHQDLLYLTNLQPYDKLELINHCLQAVPQHVQANKLVELAAVHLSLLPERLDWMYHRLLIARLSSSQLRYKPIKRVLDDMVSHAMDLLHESTDRRSHVPLLLRELVKKGCFYDQAIRAMQEFIVSDDAKERKRALKLLTFLVGYGHTKNR